FIFQFTGETIFLSLFSIIVSVIATILLLPLLNNFTGKAIPFNPFTDPLLAIFLLGLAMTIGVLAGIYPALMMSGFQPIKVLKGLKPMLGAGRGAALRQGLVIVQFALS